MQYLARTVAVEGDTLPTEFLIFSAGQNDSTKGPCLFDGIAARSVMSAYTKQGVDIMIDLEHLATKPSAPNYDPDARGWCKLELRADGSLWAVDVHWNADGAARLREKKQRYISPAFWTDENDRVVELVNVSLTALPATYEARPLVAANRLENRNMFNAETIQQVIDAIKEGNGDAALGVLEQLLAEAAGGAAPDGGGEVPSTELADPPAPDPEKEEEMMAASKIAAEARKLTGETDPAKVLAVLTALKSGASESTKLAERLSKLEADETKREVEELIRLNTKKIPPTLEAWARTQSPDAIRAFLKHAPEIKAPAAPDNSATPDLTATAADICARNKIDPKAFAEKRAQMRRGRVG